MERGSLDMKIKIKLLPGAIAPKRMSEGAAGWDVHAYIQEPVTLQPGEKAGISTGVMAALPPGYYWDGRARSGFVKYELILLNGAGVIDEDYRGVTQFYYKNLSNVPYTFNPGERIGQLILKKYEEQEYEIVDELPDTVRGAGGFGHTGK